MTPEIKKRIEQIRRGEVPEGYKKTKTGIVPVEWEEKRIGDVLKQRKTLMCISEDAPLLSFTIEEGVINPDDKKSNKRDFLIKDMATKKFALTEVGDIIYNPANLKFGAIHRNDLCRGVVSPIYGIFYGEQDSVFMGYLLHNQRFIDYAKIYTEGTVEKLKTLKADTFLKLKITLPPITEQRKISQILLTQDRIIELYQKKIYELQKLKKAVMRQIFPKNKKTTPQLRFYQFDNNWKQHKLIDLLSQPVSDGPHETPILVDEGIPFISVEAITDNKIDFDKKRGYITEEYDLKCRKKYAPQKDDVYLVKSGSTVGKVAIANTDIRFNIWSPLAAMRTNKKVLLPKYLFYFLQSKEMQEEIYEKSIGGTQPNLSMRVLENFIIKIPCINEQKSIVDALESIDNLINLQQKKLKETEKCKNSCMQLLLTGIVRANL